MRKLLTAMLLGSCVAALIGCASKPPPPKQSDLEQGMGPVSTVEMVSKNTMESDLAKNDQPLPGSVEKAQPPKLPEQAVAAHQAYEKNHRGQTDQHNPYAPTVAPKDNAGMPHGEKLMPMPVDKTYPESPNMPEAEPASMKAHAAQASDNSSQQLMSDEPPSYHKNNFKVQTDEPSESVPNQMNFPGQSSGDYDEPPLNPTKTNAMPSGQNMSPDDQFMNNSPSASADISPDQPVSSNVDEPASMKGYNVDAEKSELDQLNKS